MAGMVIVDGDGRPVDAAMSAGWSGAEADGGNG
jgi:hypothetical protein